MRSLRFPSLLVLLALWPSLLGARGCNEPAPVARLPPTAPLRFEEYGNPTTGELPVGRAQSLAGHEAHRERLFSLALQGHSTASLYWRRLEEVAGQLGTTTANEATGADCVALQAVVDEASLAKGMTPRIESFSCKKHSFLGWEEKALENQVRVDAQAALARYGGEVQVRRPGHPLFGRTVRVSRVHLVYDAKGATEQQIRYILKYAKGLGVEVHFL